MPHQKVTGECVGCHQVRQYFNAKLQLCAACAGRKGGTAPKRPRRAKFFCDFCKKPVTKNQVKCSYCGKLLDWTTLTRI